MPNDILIVDTDVLIDYSRGIEKAKERIVELDREYHLAISVITQLELMVGCNNKQDFKHLKNFLRNFEIIPLNSKISFQAVELFEKFRLSHGVLIPDMLIASTAISYDAPLLSKNMKDYRFIKGLTFLKYIH